MNTRKSVCFVCGEVFENDNEFGDCCRNHIVENHEEGIEYIKCPIDECGAVVRDLKLHFKTKHRKKRVPKNIQTTVKIWRDFDFNGNIIREKTTESWESIFRSLCSRKKAKFEGFQSDLKKLKESLYEIRESLGQIDIAIVNNSRYFRDEILKHKNSALEQLADSGDFIDHIFKKLK